MKIFFDTNILLDIFSHRDTESLFSLECFDFAADKKIIGYVAANQLDVFYYVMKKYVNKDFAFDCMKQILECFVVVPYSKFNLINGIKSDFSDFEDGCLDDCAKLYCCDGILTRNAKDFKNSKNTIYSPKDLVSLINIQPNI